MGDFDGQIYPFLRLSLMNSSCCLCSSGVSLYGLSAFHSNPGFISILWSYGRDFGNRSAIFSSKTSLYSWYSEGSCPSSVVPLSHLSANSCAGANFALIQISLSFFVGSRRSSPPSFRLIPSFLAARYRHQNSQRLSPFGQSSSTGGMGKSNLARRLKARNTSRTPQEFILAHPRTAPHPCTTSVRVFWNASLATCIHRIASCATNL